MRSADEKKRCAHGTPERDCHQEHPPLPGLHPVAGAIHNPRSTINHLCFSNGTSRTCGGRRRSASPRAIPSPSGSARSNPSEENSRLRAGPAVGKSAGRGRNASLRSAKVRARPVGSHSRFGLSRSDGSLVIGHWSFVFAAWKRMTDDSSSSTQQRGQRHREAGHRGGFGDACHSIGTRGL